jgi:radical SAM-linked protein
MQRLRLTFTKTAAMRYTGHLDLHTTWERTLRRARLPLAYSQGFHPHPKIQLAAALPLGFTSECELADVWLETPHPVDEVRARLDAAAPPGMQITAIEEAPEVGPTLQTLVRSSEYRVTIASAMSAEAMDERIAQLLAAPNLPRVRKEKQYDLRPLIESLARKTSDELSHTLHMRLSAREGATGRPEEVVEALGHSAAEARFHRERLLFNLADEARNAV